MFHLFLHLFAVGHLRSAWLWCSWWCECTWSHLVVRHACSCWKECRRKPAARDRTIEKKTEHMEWIWKKWDMYLSILQNSRITLSIREKNHVSFHSLPERHDGQQCQQDPRHGSGSRVSRDRKDIARGLRRADDILRCLVHIASTPLQTKNIQNHMGKPMASSTKEKEGLQRGAIWFIYVIKVQSRIYNTWIFWTINPHCWFWTYFASSRAPP